MGRTVAIDYGQKRTGLATTDENNIIATPLGTVRTMDLLAFLHEFTDKNKVDCFVVGESKDMNNDPSGSAMFIEPFVKKLCKEFPGMVIERMDERFTSLIATRAIREAGSKKSKRQDKALVDSISATLILQSYMESSKFAKPVDPGKHKNE
ncbi:MAG: Holliday junction resolvase RuvX [bacterium]